MGKIKQTTTIEHRKGLTAIVPSLHRRNEKKYVATVRLVTAALKELKYLRLEQITLLIENSI